MSLIEQAKAERRRQLAAEKHMGSLIFSMDFSTSEKMFDVLANLPASYFPEYVPDPERTYFKGDVVRGGEVEKYMAQNQTTTSAHPSQNPMFKLFRDGGLYEWVREEYCLRGFVRSYAGKWYEVTAARVDSATPPPNDPASWKEIEGGEIIG